MNAGVTLIMNVQLGKEETLDLGTLEKNMVLQSSFDREGLSHCYVHKCITEKDTHLLQHYRLSLSSIQACKSDSGIAERNTAVKLTDFLFSVRGK